MATLLVTLPGGSPVPVPLLKPLTSLGATADCDVRVPEMKGVVAVQFDGVRFTAAGMSGGTFVLNGKKRDESVLKDGDQLLLGKTTIVFQAADRIPTPIEVARVRAA